MEAVGARPGCSCERGLSLTVYEDKAALYQSNVPVALIPQRPQSQDQTHCFAGADIFGFAVIMTVGILVVCIQQMVDGGYANAAYADLLFRPCC